MKEMIPVLLNPNFERIAELDNFKSFIWTTRYYSAGDFEVCIDISVVSMLQIGYMIARKGDYSHFGIIESVQIQMTEDREEVAVLKGRLLPCILGRRIIANQTQLNAKVSTCIEALINENVISPTISARQISNVTIDNDITGDSEIEVQYTGENLLEVISSICETYGVGFDMTYEGGNFIVHLFEGTDRSYDQTTNPYIVFSDVYDNLLTAEYNEDHSEYATDVLVGGEGEGVNQTIVWSAEDSKSGLDRYEIYLDASSSVTNENIITQATYESQLNELGLQEISNHTTYTEAFSGTVDFSGVEFGVDVFIGDIVTIENTRWGMSINSRIVEVIESIGEDGTYTAVPTFGA